jgi:hypothetical protein
VTECLQPIGIVLSVCALTLSLLSIYFARKFWRDSHRPFVTAKVIPIQWNSLHLNLVLSNTGNRPAKDIKITLSRPHEMSEALNPNAEPQKRQYVDSCFRVVIPILANGIDMTANFGSLEDTWKNEGNTGKYIGIRIGYRDVEDDRVFCHYQDIRLARVKSFAEGAWEEQATAISVKSLPIIDIKKRSETRVQK